MLERAVKGCRSLYNLTKLQYDSLGKAPIFLVPTSVFLPASGRHLKVCPSRLPSFLSLKRPLAKEKNMSEHDTVIMPTVAIYALGSC